jgi:Ni2+-binding GTPase involved in maturation of urease and hydrogenase
MSNNKQFVNGVRAYKPKDNAPTWIVANLLINKQDLVQWLQSQPDVIRADIKQSKTGTYYLEVNSYEGSKEPVNASNTIAETKDDLPF